MSDFSFLLVAGGGGTRLGGKPKQFRRLGGIPMWMWSAHRAVALYERGLISQLVAVFPTSYIDEAYRHLESLAVPSVAVAGGNERTDSVKNGLAACNGRFVMVHDGARPFLSDDICCALMESARLGRASVPLIRCTDAIKRVAKGHGMSPEDRDTLYITQTPQVFPKSELLDIIARAGGGAFDEAQLWIEAGLSISHVEGDRRLFKITDTWDWEVACRMAAQVGKELMVPVMGEMRMRVGHGFDIHPLVPGRPLILGGVHIESELGLMGHSDADVVCHAISDALLGAAGEPDIGMLYPASDERYRGADSLELLGCVAQLVAQKGFCVEWVDITLQAQTPRLGSFIDNISQKIEGKIGNSNRKKVNIKVKSGEHTGSTGRGECMICHAVATLSFADA